MRAEMRLNVAVYSPCWNEETILPFYLSHYAKFARTINLFDNQSSDRSPEIIAEFQRQHRDVKIKFGAFHTDGQLRDDIFDPDEIVEIAYLPGAHACKPKGNVRVFHDKSVKLLHYKALGFDHMFERIQLLRARVSDVNRRNRWRMEYDDEESVHRRWFDTLNREAGDVF